MTKYRIRFFVFVDFAEFTKRLNLYNFYYGIQTSVFEICFHWIGDYTTFYIADRVQTRNQSQDLVQCQGYLSSFRRLLLVLDTNLTTSLSFLFHHVRSLRSLRCGFARQQIGAVEISLFQSSHYRLLRCRQTLNPIT